MSAHVGQSGRIDSPSSARELHTANERQLWRRMARALAAALQHSAVKAGVMGSQLVRAVEHLDESRPGFGEGRSIGQVFPGKTVNVTEEDVRAWRTQELHAALDDFEV